MNTKICDEGSYAILLAAQDQLPFIGGEPTELEIKMAILDRGRKIEDLLGFYVVRQIPEWKRQGTFHEAGLPKRIDKFILDYAAVFGAGRDFTFEKFRLWYHSKTNRDFLPNSITTEDPAPISGPDTTDINVISLEVEKTRNDHLIAEIAHLATQYQKVLIVYGQGHLKELRPELQKIYGKAVNCNRF